MQLTEWMAADELDDPEYRADLRCGIICATIANCNRAKGRKPYVPSDFLGWLKDANPEDKDAMSNDEMKSFFRGLAARYNARKRKEAAQQARASQRAAAPSRAGRGAKAPAKSRPREAAKKPVAAKSKRHS